MKPVKTGRISALWRLDSEELVLVLYVDSVSHTMLTGMTSTKLWDLFNSIEANVCEITDIDPKCAVSL